MGYEIVKYVYGAFGEVIGVIIADDSGDGWYLTIEEYDKFIKNRGKNGYKA